MYDCHYTRDMKKYAQLSLILSVILLVLAGVCIWWEKYYPFLHLPRMIVGSFVVLLVPWYWITRWTFPYTGEEKLMDPTDEKAKPAEDQEIHTIDWLERWVLSVALSISSVPLILFYINFLGVPLTVWSVYWTIVFVTIVSMIASLFIEQKHAQAQQ